jgi:C4-dicarboxylate-specific signal transduction histidine kinase
MFSLFLIFASVIYADSVPVSPKVQKEAEKILDWTKDPELIDALRKQNEAPTTLEQIQVLDAQWQDGTIPHDFVASKLESPCAKKLQELQKEIPSAAESMLIDSQGALVCSSAKTSDYWQGDEAKWKDAFNSDKPLVYGARSYDLSTKSTLMHISAPVKQDSKTIGVISVGINLLKLSEN